MFAEPLPTDITDCFVCGLPATVIDAFTMPDSDGNEVWHHKTRCADSHVIWETIN